MFSRSSCYETVVRALHILGSRELAFIYLALILGVAFRSVTEQGQETIEEHTASGALSVLLLLSLRSSRPLRTKDKSKNPYTRPVVFYFSSCTKYSSCFLYK